MTLKRLALTRLAPLARLSLSLLLELLSHLAKTVYDALGLHYSGNRLGFAKIALTSFISYVFSNNIGFEAITSGLMRYRLYSLFGRVDFTHLLAVFMLAQVIALVSHVQGGLGVFETTVFFCLPQNLPKAEMFGYLLAFRFL